MNHFLPTVGDSIVQCHPAGSKDQIMELSAKVSLGPGGMEDHPAPCGFGGIVMGLLEMVRRLCICI